MITFKQFITELFGEGASTYKVIDRSSDAPAGDYRYSFKTEDDLTYTVNITAKGRTYEVEFYAIEGDYVSAPSADQKMYKPLKNYKNSFRASNSLKVYNTVAEIVRTNLANKLKQGDGIVFGAASTSTIKLYQFFATKIAKAIGGEIIELGPNYWAVVKSRRNWYWPSKIA